MGAKQSKGEVSEAVLRFLDWASKWMLMPPASPGAVKLVETQLARSVLELMILEGLAGIQRQMSTKQLMLPNTRTAEQRSGYPWHIDGN